MGPVVSIRLSAWICEPAHLPSHHRVTRERKKGAEAAEVPCLPAVQNVVDDLVLRHVKAPAVPARGNFPGEQLNSGQISQQLHDLISEFSWLSGVSANWRRDDLPDGVGNYFWFAPDA